MKNVMMFFACCLMLFTGCDLLNNKVSSEPGVGTVRISINQSVETNQRSTIVPELDMAIVLYRVYATGPAGLEYGPEDFQDGQTIELAGLIQGSWTFQIQGLNVAGTVVGIGSRSVQVLAEQTIAVDITIVPVQGNGTLSLSFAWPSALLANPTIQATLTGSGSEVEDLAFSVDAVAGTAVYSGAWPAGYYGLRLALYVGSHKVWGTYRAVRLLGGETSLAEYDLTAAELTLPSTQPEPPVPSLFTFDDGVVPAGFEMSSTSGWVLTNAEYNSSTYSLKAGTISHNQSSMVTYTATVPTGKTLTGISFYRKVSSESSWDYLRFNINGVQQQAWAGEHAWGQITYPLSLSEGTEFSLAWNYTKDGSVNSGQDTAWIDDIQLQYETAAF